VETRWKLNLAILCCGQLLVMGGMTMVIPFLALYIQELGITDPFAVGMWTGLIFAANFLSSFIFQPIWGRLADRVGRKIMLLRSALGMAIVIGLMGLATNVWHLLFLRLLNGMVSGFNPAAIAITSANTPTHRIGFAMGSLQSASVAGLIMGPLFGGLLAEMLDSFRPIFFLTGGLLVLVSLLMLGFIREQFDRKEAAKQERTGIISGLRRLLENRGMGSLFTITFMLQFSLFSTLPLLALFVQEITHNSERIIFYAGLVGAVTGAANLIASPLLGWLGDRIGYQYILIGSLLGAVCALIPQAFVQQFWTFLSLRFLFGIFMGGLLPSIHALLRTATPKGMESRAYGYNSSFLSLGNFLGPIIGGLCAGWLSIRGVFLLSACLLLLSSVWMLAKIRRGTFDIKETTTT
jgi:DHA1 family multidrug resistance protein-like MFS transporter